MNAFALLAVLLLGVAVVSAVPPTPTPAAPKTGKNEQSGRFYFYKVRPKQAKDVEVLLKGNDAYENHPPLFLQPVAQGETAYVLIEQSKVQVFERVLRTNRIKFEPKGLSLVSKIAVHTPVAGRANPHCDCDYHSGGCMISHAPPEGYACKCVYKPLWRCTGYSFSCDPGMHCPANCSSLQCCLNGRGDCGGY